MTLRKITIDNSVRYVKKSDQTREQNQPISGGKPNTRKPSKEITKQ